MNQAFMAKMGWRIEVKQDKLWTQALRTKYNHRQHGIQAVKDKREASNLWRGLCKAKHVVQNGMRFKVNNGKRAKFWTDIWIDDQVLMNWAPPELTEEQRNGTVTHFWSDEVGWNWNKIGDRLPEDIKKKLQMLNLTDKTAEEDEAYWSKDKTGNFSVASAYESINGSNFAMQDPGWSAIWKTKVLSKMQSFMWLARHE